MPACSPMHRTFWFKRMSEIVGSLAMRYIRYYRSSYGSSCAIITCCDVTYEHGSEQFRDNINFVFEFERSNRTPECLAAMHSCQRYSVCVCFCDCANRSFARFPHIAYISICALTSVTSLQSFMRRRGNKPPPPPSSSVVEAAVVVARRIGSRWIVYGATGVVNNSVSLTTPLIL